MSAPPAAARARGALRMTWCGRCFAYHLPDRCAYPADEWTMRTETAPPPRRRVRQPDVIRPLLITDCRDPFRPRRDRDTRRVRWAPDVTVRDLLSAARRAQDPGQFVVSLNGRRVGPEVWDTPLRPGDSLLVCTRPADPVSAVIGVVALITSVWMAIDGAKRAKIQQHHAARRAAAKAQQMEDSLVYGWDGIRNSITPGRAIPVLYGRHRVGGHYVYTETRPASPQDDRLDAQIIVAQGEIAGIIAPTPDFPITQTGVSQAAGLSTAIETIEINQAPAKDFAGAVFEERVGDLNPSSVLGVWPTLIPRTKNSPGNVLDPTGGTPTTYISEPNRTGFKVQINYPDPLRAQFSSGVSAGSQATPFRIAQLTYQFNYSLEVRRFPSGTVVGTFPFSSPKIPGRVAKNPTQVLIPNPSTVFKTPDLGSDRYELRLTVTSIVVTNRTGGQTYVWPTSGTIPRIVLGEVQEFNEVVQVYPGLASLSLSLKASDKLGGSLPTITAIYEGLKVRQYTVEPEEVFLTGSAGTTVALPSDEFEDLSTDFVAAGVVPGDRLEWTGPTVLIDRVIIVAVLSTTRVRCTTVEGANPFFTSTSGITWEVSSKEGQFTVGFTRNPAWCILDVLANPVHGGGGRLNYAKDFDIGAFQEAATFCDVLVSRGLDATDPQLSGAAGRTVGGTNVFIPDFSSPIDLTGSTIRREDTLVISSGANAGTYVVDDFGPPFNTTGRMRVLNTDGTTPSFTTDTAVTFVINNTQRRSRCDHYFDGTGNIWEAAAAIARNARLALVRSGGKVKLIADESSGVIALFSMGNIVPGTYRHHYLGRRNVANRVEIQFLDERKNWTQQVAELEDPEALTAGRPIIKIQAEAFGVSRSEQAMRIAKYVYFSNRVERKLIEFETDEFLALEWGDEFLFTHDAMPFPNAQLPPLEGGRVLGVTPGSPGEVLIDRALTIRSIATFVRFQRITDGGITSDDLTGQVGETTHRLSVTFTAGAITKGDVWVVGPLLVDDPDPNHYKIVAITRSGILRRKIRAVLHDPTMYSDPAENDDIDHIGDFPDFNG